MPSIAKKQLVLYSKPQIINKDLSSTKKLRPSTPPIVPAVIDLRYMLVKIYNKDDTNISSYIEQKYVNEIAKLLTKYHGNYDKFFLKDTTFFYPSIEGSVQQLPDCQYFKIHKKLYEREVVCDACTSIKRKQKRNERRTIESPTRSRAFNSLTPQD